MTYYFNVIITSIFVLVSLTNGLNYRSNQELLDYLRDFEKRFPNISEVYSIGQSVKGVDLLVLKLTTTQDELAPNVKFIGNMHGNEAITREVLLQFIEYIGTSYLSDIRIKALLNSTIIHILPSLNPDGFSSLKARLCDGELGRHNANQIDLNRNYANIKGITSSVEQPETLAVKNWMRKIKFALSASLHSGGLVANYPFDSAVNIGNKNSGGESLAPDDDVLKHLALVYSNNHLTMYKGNSCGLHFPNGITNGAKWYSFENGMGDYNYCIEGTMELTLEICCCKYPVSTQILKVWNENKMALIEYAFQATHGVRGIIQDYNNTLNNNAISLMIAKRKILFHPDSQGRFWRILLPGKYTLMILSNQDIIHRIQFSVTNESMTTLYPILLENISESSSTLPTTIPWTRNSAEITETVTQQTKLDNITRNTAIAFEINAFCIFFALLISI